MTADVY
jgi:phosphotransferase system enzyme I (PtsP)